tara:strand:+ start:1412 stop:1855 length:444 start_codon:yes stop_codon:yes gene_type:complete
MKKALFIFVFLISCSSVDAEISNVQEESSVETVTTFSSATTEAIHDHSEEHDDHSEEHDDHDIETSIMVPQGIPDKLEVLNYELGEIVEINFISDAEVEIHIHGYDIHFMVYPNQDNILKIELTIAGELEIEEHDSGYEFARMIVSP